jgi:signal transduction histidine kinase/ligand-binding sensor domain-containing protein
LVVCLLVVALTAGAGSAQDRLVRRFSDGQQVQPPIVTLAQDSSGFLWVGTRAGLFRSDGARFRRWAPDSLPRAVGTVVVSGAGQALAVDADGRLLELTAGGARVLPGRPRRSPDYLHVAAFDRADRLWVITDDGTIEWRDSVGGWQALPASALEGDSARRIYPAGVRGGVLVAGHDALWHVRPGVAPLRLLDGHRIVDVLARADGVIIALSSSVSLSAALVRLRPGAPAEVLDWRGTVPGTRAISLAEREGTIWVGTDRYLLAMVPGGPPEVLGPDHGIRAGGPLLVDREGSLWQGGFAALSQYPEPATRLWDQRHGLSSELTRYIARSGDVVWAATWQGPTYLQREQGRWQPGRESRWASVGRICPDGQGGVWSGSNVGVVRLRGLELDIVHPEGAPSFNQCSPSADGGLWIATESGLQRLSKDGTAVTPVGPLPAVSAGGEAPSAIQAVLEDGSGRLWASSYDRVCHASGERIRTGAAGDWTCEPLPAGSVHLNVILELPGGILWAASTAMGMLRRTENGWDVLPDNRRLPTRSVLNLVPSPRGGIWLVGAGILQRVAPGPAGAGWTVLERLSAWHGLPSIGGGDLLEEEDGTIWIATSQGVAHVPASVRTAQPLPPNMAVVEARVEGELVPLDGELVVPADRNHLELRFAALTFRDPSLVRYQVRLSREDPWVDTEAQPTVTWVDLPPGRHRPQVRATLDGVAWSPRPADLSLHVLPPWFRTGWAIAGFVLITGALLFGLYRARLAYLLGLERQRTRIAMDLHDEMGSGLASIGILAGVLSENGGTGDQRIAGEVAATAEELGTALSDIVWSLDPQGASLEELAARLSEHGGRLFADDVEFDTDFPAQWPGAPLPLPVLRNVLLIGLEALNNAATHAGARRVLLSVLPEQDGWLMIVRDDGAGVHAGRRKHGGGHGLRTMRRRAQEIGGDIAFHMRPGEGTTVRLRFQMQHRRKLLSWLRRHRRPAGADVSHEHASANESSGAHS